MNIEKYIKNHEKLKNLDFLTVYETILTLMKDGYIMVAEDVYLLQSKSV